MNGGWTDRLARFWFHFKTLAVRGRFLTGKASFVEADVQRTENSVAELLDENGRPLGPRLLAHYKLNTRKPRTGTQGWRLFAERSFSPSREKPVSLECAYCGHLFFVQVLPAADPLSPEHAGGRPVATPASYASEWFRFMRESFRGEPSLSCFHCEQKSRPRVSF